MTQVRRPSPPRAAAGNAREAGAGLDAAATLGDELRAAAARNRLTQDELEALAEVARMLSSELELQPLLQRVTDAATRFTGAKYGAFFHNAVNDSGESYMLYTLSGAPREAFERFGLPRNTALFEPTFRGTGVVRSDDVRKDPRYGKNAPHRGMPQGHLPVRSYLAVPLRTRAGEVLGGLFLGHPEPAVFDESAERLALGIAAQAAVAIDNARLITAAKREIGERARVEQELRDSEARFHAAFDNAAMGMALGSLDHRWLQVNDALCRLTGYAREELVGRPINEITHPDDRQETRELTRQVGAGAKPSFTLDKRYLHKSGRTIWVRVTVSLIRNAAGVPESFIGLIENITEHKRAEALLRDRERLSRLMLQNLPAALYTCDAQGRVTFFNGAAAELWGREPRLGKDLWCGSWRIFNVDGTPLPLDQCPMALALKQGRAVRGAEILVERPDGTRRYVRPHPEPIRDESGAVIGAINMLVDVTADRQSQQATALLGAIVDSSDDAIISKNLDGIITSWNQGAARLFGYSADEAVGRPVTMLIPAERVDEENRILERLRRGERVDHFETVRVRKDGTRFEVSLTISPVRDAGGRIIGASKIARDISALKQAQAALRASEAKFAAAFGESPLGITITSLETGKLIEVNQGLLDVSGYTREELIGRSPDEVGLWLDQEQRRQRFAALARGERPPDIEASFRIKDGRVLTALVASNLIPVDGKPCVLTSVVDITERKQAEAALRASEARQRFLVELSTATQALSHPDRIMAVTAQLLGQHLGADRCAYAEVTPDEATAIITGDYTRGVPSMVGRTPLVAFGDKVWNMLRDNKTYVTHDVDTDPRSPADLSVYRQTMIRAAIAVPLHKDGRLTAGMAVTQSTPRQWQQEEVELVELVVNRCWETIERARAVRNLAESEARARIALDVSGQGTWSLEPASDVVAADTRCREICGLKPRGRLKLSDLMAHVHADDVARVEKALAAALSPRGDGNYAEEFRFVHTDGSERWVLSRGQTRFTGDNGARRPEVLLATVLDITERKRAEERLRDNDRRKDEFLATLAHELRNPLAPLRNSLHILRMSQGAEPLHEMMERQVNHMVRLVDDLLEVSRISRGKIELKRERLRLNTLLYDVLETARPQIAAAGHELTVTLPPEPLVLDADPVRLAQVFGNLLNNASKYTPAGGHVWLTALRDEDYAVISVRDNGVGIPPDMLGRVFDVFTQVEHNLNRAQGGLGIGLSLVRSLLKLHGGSIEARSGGRGQGTEFIVRLPLALERRAAPRLPAATGDEAAGGGDAPLRAPRRVLVVDDNKDAADSLGMLLRYLGADVHVAHSGAEALAALDSHRPSAVLLDLGMPGMDGFEVARRMREQRGDTIQLIALTGWGQEEDRRRTREAGFDHHLIKPPEIASLQAVLAALDERAAPPPGERPPEPRAPA